MSHPIWIALLLGSTVGNAICGVADSKTLADLNEPIVLNFSEVPGADNFAVPVQAADLQVYLNARAAAWAAPELDWLHRKMIVRLLGPSGDPNAGVHARAIRDVMRRSSGGNRLAVCVKTKTGACRQFTVTVAETNYRDALWIAILGLGILLPVLFPRVLRTRVRDSNGKRTGMERLSLSATIFYVWNIVVLASVAFVWATSGEWTVNQTAMSLLGLAGATRGGAKLVPGSRVSAITTQPVPGTSGAAAVPQALAGAQLVADPAQPGPAPQPPATPPSGEVSIEPSPIALAALTQPVLRILSQTLTDSDGPAVHRIELAVWTALLVCWYLRAVYLDWALPQFDLSLLGIGTVSGGFHVLSKPAEQISRNVLSPR